MRKTKIICTMGPAVESEEKIEALMDAGMDGARLNFSHGTHQQHRIVVERLKAARLKKRRPLAIILDTKGPEIRLGEIEGDALSVQAGERLILTKQTTLGTKEGGISVTPANVIDALQVGAKVLIDDGYITTQVVEKQKDRVVIELFNAGMIKTRKGVNVPDVEIALPAMTEQDIEDIKFGVQQGIDVIAASFIRSKEHVIEIKLLLSKLKASHILVLAKIENSLGVRNFDEILEVADGIMVARGDLGVELPLKEVPRLQKMMIRKCYRAGKPVVTATQMLESMIKNPRPTRAEVSDVANAIYDSTSAVMLSGETAVGQYPIETVAMMKSIVEETERDFNYRSFFHLYEHATFHDISSSIALAAVQTAYSAHAKGIFCFTHTGFTARHVSRFRPELPIVALSPYERVYHQMALTWGVIPVHPVVANNVQEALKIVSEFSLSCGLLKKGDLIVATAGTPFGQSGSTNMMFVERINPS